ncbi:MAG: DUF4386 domain-containing protein [Ginsengibacter sp.]
MRTEKIIGTLLILGVIGVLIPYTALTIIFNYPDILRQDAGIILTKFHEGGATLIFVWFLFAILGLPVLMAYILIGQKLESKFYFVRWATTFGVVSVIVQMAGLLRWVFVVPVLATDFVTATDETTKETARIIFKAIHQYGGVLLGEHLGQLFTVAWTIIIAIAFNKLRLFQKWVTWLGFISAGIYLLAQGDLFATVIPGFPVWNLAGLIGSTLWLIWLHIVGIKFLRANVK